MSFDDDNDGGMRWYAEVGQYEWKGAPRPVDWGKEYAMSLTMKDNGGGDFRKVPQGVYMARCYQLVDLGTQEVDWQGQTKLQDKVAVYWELHGEDDAGVPLVIDNGDPMTIFSTYTASLGKKAKLRADLEAWRGKPFTDEELKGFDMSKLLGAWCMVNVVHAESNGKTYANVKSITPLPAALRRNTPAPVLSNVKFDLDEFDEQVFETFHEKLREKINNSLQRKEGTSAKGGVVQQKSVPATNPQSLETMDDDIPF